jgi:hypothetical protein
MRNRNVGVGCGYRPKFGLVAAIKKLLYCVHKQVGGKANRHPTKIKITLTDI